MRDRRVARVIDREIAPIWHDRFARLIVRNLPGSSDVIALDIHCGVGRTTAELLARLGPAARVLAIEPDDTLIEFAKTRMRPEWKNRVYLKPGNFDDVTAMADDSYNLVVANLVLGDTGDLSAALTEMIRVNRIGGRILATLPLADSWNEVEDIFAEVLRDAGLTAAVNRLARLRELRPTGPQLSQIVRGLGVAEDDFVIEQERFQMLFPSGREFLFAPVVEHGPLRLWKAVIGKDGSPQELFWRLKEAIDTYYTGHVLAVNVMAGLMNIHVAKGTESPGPRLAARFWRHYPGLDALWGGLAAGYVRVSEPSLPPFGDVEFDFDIQIDDAEARRTGTQKPVTTSIPIVTDDLDAPEPGDFAGFGDIAGATGTPAPAYRPAPGARTGAEPARPLATLQQNHQSQARFKRPPVAEDDFSNLDDQVDSTPSFRARELAEAERVAVEERTAALAQAEAEDQAAYDEQERQDEADEPSEPTSTFSPGDLRAARDPAILGDSEPTAGLEDLEAAADADEAARAARSDVEAEIAADIAAAAAEREAAEAEARARFEADQALATVEHDAAEETDAEELDPDASDSSMLTEAPPPPRTPPPRLPTRPPTGPNVDRFRRPSSESSGFTPRLAPEPAAARTSSETSGFTRPSGESSGFMRPSAESSGFMRPSAETSGFMRPSAESSGFTPVSATSGTFLRSSARASESPSTSGTFNVFAPPRPRADELDPASSAIDMIRTDMSIEPSGVREVPPGEHLASLHASLAELGEPSPAFTSSSARQQPPEDAEELDELESLDEAEELVDEEPMVAAPRPSSAPPPPRAKAPPPPPSNMFKPRPLLPIVPPKKK